MSFPVTQVIHSGTHIREEPLNRVEEQARRDDTPASKPKENKGENDFFFLKFSEYANKGAACINLATAIAGQLNLFDSYQELVDKITTVFTKGGTVLQGLIKAKQAFERKNLAATVGSALELPVALLSDGYNLWLARGISQGASQYDAMMTRVKKVDQNGNVVIKDGKEQLYTDFKEEGFIEGSKITLRENIKCIKECFTNPLEKTGITSRLISLFSTFQIGGALLAFAGLQKFGAGIRDLGGAAVDIAFMTDKGEGENNKALYKAGVKWVFSAIVDFLKRFESFSLISMPTQLSLFFDRWAAVDYIKEGERVKSEAA